MELITALDKMETCAEKNDNRGFYKALLDFTAAGIGSTKNPVLLKVVMGIMPNLQRLQYIAIMLKNDSLKENVSYFRTIIEALGEKNPEKGVKAIEAYIHSEKDYALSLVKNSPLSSFLIDDPVGPE
ncbi:MAG: FCD domain-containing protein [Proteobacteria bacterium]|nr:FCD domain-containing protein [Pseudomonadota bacterium]